MPKETAKIIDISDGINSDYSSKVISDQSVVLSKNILLDRAGKIIPTDGYLNSGTGYSFDTSNPEMSFYSFRTDDGAATPKEYLMHQKSNGDIDMRNVASLGYVEITISASVNMGMHYSNGIFFAYPRASGNAFIIKAGAWNNKFELNYDTLKLSTAVHFIDSQNVSSFVSGQESNPDVKIDFIENQSDEIGGNVATGFIDLNGKTFVGGWVNIDYRGQTYTVMVSHSPTPLQFGHMLASAINNSSEVPLSMSFNTSALTAIITSKYDGSLGNGAVIIYAQSGGESFFQFPLVGGEDPDFDDAGNVDKVLPSGRYTFAASLLLWDGSETSISETSSSIFFEDRFAAKVRITVNYNSFNDFIKGIKFYLKSESFEYSLLGEYKPTGKKFKFYNENDFLTESDVSHQIDLTLPFRSTFRFEAGYDHNKSSSPKFKKFLVVNNRGYALNVAYNGQWHQDRIIVSPAGRTYLLPEENKIDIVTEDGDEYISASHFGSLLYCFKRNNLFLVNIASNDPSSFYLVDSIYGAGVESDSAVTRTEFGVFWANKHGIYLHNGQQIQNLVLGRIEDEWKALPSSNIRCGYDVIDKKVFIVRDTTTYIFDFKSQSFTKITTLPSGVKSNFVNIGDELYLCNQTNNTLFKAVYSHSGSNEWELVTKSYDFGFPAVRKKVRRFYVTFLQNNVNLSNITFEYRLDDHSSWTRITSASFINNDDGVSKNTVAMFDLPRSITAYFVQVRIRSTQNVGINDISIIYRSKHPK